MKKKVTLAMTVAVMLCQIIGQAQCTLTASITPGGPTSFCSGGNVILTANTTGNTWVQKLSFGVIVRRLAVGFSIGSKGYVGTGDNGGSGLNDFWEYNPATGAWTQKANFAGGVRYGACGFGIGSKGYVGGGRGAGVSKDDFWEYNPATNTWTQKANMGGGVRMSASAFALGSKGYIGTGCTSPGIGYKNDFWEYTPATNTWLQKANFGGTARSAAVGFAIGTKGYIGTGAMGAAGTEKNDFWEYDPINNLWTQKANFGGSVRAHAVGFGIGTNGYIGTGFDWSGSSINDVWQYSQPTNTWTQKASFTYYRNAAVGFSIGNRGYLSSGTNSASGFSQNDLWEYTPSTTYLWSNGSTEQSTSASLSGMYSVTLTDAQGCTATASKSITVMTTPTVTISGTTPICQGESTILTAAGANSYTWGANAGSATTNTVSVTPLGTTTYSVIGTNANGCSHIMSKTVTVYPVPVVTITGNSFVCQGSSVVLNASGQQSYTWSPNAGSAHTHSVLVTPSVTTTYTVTETNKYGCKGMAVKTVSVLPNPIITVNTVNPICQGDQTVLTATGGFIYQWASAGGSFTGLSYTVSPNVTTNYTVTALDTSGCATSVLQTVIVLPTPTVTISGSGAVCQGVPVTLIASGADTYQWDVNAGNATASAVTIYPDTTRVYSVQGLNANGCFQMASYTVVVYPMPQLSIVGPNSSCLGEYSVLTASGANTYHWSMNAGSANSSAVTVSPSSAGTIPYTVTGVSVHGCVSLLIHTMTVYANPSVVISGNSSIGQGDHTILTASGANTYTWSANAASATTNTVDVAPFALGYTVYSVIGEDTNGCSGSFYYTVEVGNPTQKLAAPAIVQQELSSELSIGIYPNPSHDYMTIHSDYVDGSAFLELYDMTGRLIYSQTLKSKQERLSMGDYANGIYQIRILNDSKLMYQTKIIKH